MLTALSMARALAGSVLQPQQHPVPEVMVGPRLCLSTEQMAFPSCCIFLPTRAQESPELWQGAGCTSPLRRALEASPGLCSSAGLLGSPSLRGQAAEAQAPQLSAEDSAAAEDWRVPGEDKCPRAPETWPR